MKPQWYTYSGTYPRGYTHTRILLSADSWSGGYDHVDGGFLPFGAKKPSRTEHDAKKRVIQKLKQRITRLAAEINQLERELETET